MFRPGIVVVTVLAFSSAPAEVVFDERFEQDPCAPSSGWVCRDNAVWVAPGAAPCPSDDPGFFAPWSTFDPLGPCTISPGNGHALLTPSLPERGGAIYRMEPTTLHHLRLTVEFELRDGPPGGEGDGLAVVLVGSPDPPQLGSPGAGLGATGLGQHPTFICAFRNMPGGDPDQDEIVYTWSKSGFAAGASLPGAQGYAIELGPDTLNAGVPHPAPPDVFVFNLQILEGRFQGSLWNRNRRSWVGSFDFMPEDYEPLNGFVGVTAMTSESYQNHILHHVRLETIQHPPQFVRGDTNASGEIDLSDGILVIGWLFLWAPEPPCQDAADTDDNGTLNITDGVRVLNWLFLGGPAPPDPGPLACGTDPTPDELPRCEYPWCE